MQQLKTVLYVLSLKNNIKSKFVTINSTREMKKKNNILF